jgi:hypothetical protein
MTAAKTTLVIPIYIHLPFPLLNIGVNETDRLICCHVQLSQAVLYPVWTITFKINNTESEGNKTVKLR